MESFASANISDWLSSDFLPRFFEQGQRIYTNDPWFTPSTLAAFTKELLRPTWLAQQKCFLLDGGRITARIRREEDEPWGLLSHFECENSEPKAKALFETSIAWLKENGCTRIIGPIDGDTWHRYRVNVGPFELPPYFLEPYNPPYYGALWQAAGAEVLEEYSSKHVESIAAAKAPFVESYHSLLEAGYRLRPCKLSAFENELRLLHHITQRSFNKNFLYTELPETEFIELYAPIKPLLVAEDIHFLLDSTGKEVGFLFAVPDYRQALRALRRGGALLGKLHFLWLARKADTLNFKTLGILPEHRQRGMAKALFYHAYTQAEARGLEAANLCTMKSDNPSQRLDGGFGKVFRRYILFEFK